MTNSLLPGNANHTLSHSVYSEDWGRDKERSQRASFCEEWGVFGREKTGGWGSWKYLVQHLPLWNQADEFAFVFLFKK